MEKILVVSAHPDDETLGLGGTIKLHSLSGSNVCVLNFADGESARKKSMKNILKRKKQGEKAATILGIKETQFLDYEDQKLDTIPILELSKHIESAIKKWNPSIIYTHFWGDVNQDHRVLFEATIIATRPTPNSKIKKIICYETPSSTEWGYQQFNPNYFIDISKVKKVKIKAFQQYKDEIKSFPHPRSEESIMNRSNYWGSSVGIKNAEAFFILRDIIRN
jgi:LmbE family N-acetylglucosaminyl deacetylase